MLIGGEIAKDGDAGGRLEGIKFLAELCELVAGGLE